MKTALIYRDRMILLFFFWPHAPVCPAQNVEGAVWGICTIRASAIVQFLVGWAKNTRSLYLWKKKHLRSLLDGAGENQKLLHLLTNPNRQQGYPTPSMLSVGYRCRTLSFFFPTAIDFSCVGVVIVRNRVVIVRSRKRIITGDHS